MNQKNNYKLLISSVVFLFLFLSSSYAAERFISPLGFKIGHATYDSIKKDWKHKILLRDISVNRFTGGRVLEAEAPEFLGVNGLRGLRLMFNSENVLTAVVMNLVRAGDSTQQGVDAGFLEVYDMLDSKYSITSKDFSSKKPAMKAQFYADNVYIQMLAPRNKSLFELRYLSRDFINQRDAVIQAQNEQSEYAMQTVQKLTSRNQF